MKKEDFLNRIYQQLGVGTRMLIPKRQTKIMEIRESGDIVYLIANSYKKVLSRGELEQVFEHLQRGSLKTSTIRKIVTSSRTCNVSTIKWILENLNLASIDNNKEWARTWP